MKLTESKRKKLKKTQFALPSQRKYPIYDYDHAVAAVARAEQQYNAGNLSSADRKKIYKAIWKKYPKSHDWPSMEEVLGRKGNPDCSIRSVNQNQWLYFIRKYMEWKSEKSDDGVMVKVGTLDMNSADTSDHDFFSDFPVDSTDWHSWIHPPLYDFEILLWDMEKDPDNVYYDISGPRPTWVTRIAGFDWDHQNRF